MPSTPIVTDQDFERVFAVDAVIHVFAENETYRFPVKKGCVTAWDDKTICVDHVPYSRQGNTFVSILPLIH